MTCTRRLTFSAGHRVMGHESVCANPHGHNYVAEIEADADELDSVGRVVDFSVIKKGVGGWIDKNWDHAFLLNNDDEELIEAFGPYKWPVYLMDGNPTAENMAAHLLTVSAQLLEPYDVHVLRVVIRETENCWAEALSD